MISALLLALVAETSEPPKKLTGVCAELYQEAGRCGQERVNAQADLKLCIGRELRLEKRITDMTMAVVAEPPEPAGWSTGDVVVFSVGSFAVGFGVGVLVVALLAAD